MEIFILEMEMGKRLVEIASTGYGADRKWWQRDYTVGNWVPYQTMKIPGMINGDGWYETGRGNEKEVNEWHFEFTCLRARLWFKECPESTELETWATFPSLEMPKYYDNSGGTVICPQPTVWDIKQALEGGKFTRWQMIRTETF